MSKGKSAPAATTQTTTTEFPTELKPYITDILTRAKARQVSEEQAGFQPYTGPRIAQFTPEQLQAQQATKGVVAGGISGDPTLSSAQTYAKPALALTMGQAQQFTPAVAQQYMSPYQQAVVNLEKREAIRAAQPQMQQIGAQAVGAGGFGGSRQAILQAEAQRNLQQQLGDIQTRGSQQAFNQAQAAFEAQKARERGAAGSLSAMGAAMPAQALKEIGALEAVGAAQRADTQRGLDLAYQQFQEEQMFPTKTLQEYQSIVRGFPYTPNTYTASQTVMPPASMAQNVLGIGTGIAGLAGAFGGFKEGGVINKQVGGDFTMDESASMPASPSKSKTFSFEDGERRVASTFGKEKQYEYKGGTWYEVKDDNTLGRKAPPLVAMNLMNVDEEGEAESPIVGTSQKPLVTGEDRDIGTMLFNPDEEFELTTTSKTQGPPVQTTTTKEPTQENVTAALATAANTSSKDMDAAAAKNTITQAEANTKASEVGAMEQLAKDLLSGSSKSTETGALKNLSDIESFLSKQFQTIQDREFLTPEMVAYKKEYAKLREGLGEKESRKKEDLKRQKYLQLAQFGANLLGADTTKGLLQQIGEAGKAPLKEVGKIVTAEGEILDKIDAERLGILGKEADIAQAEQTAERQKITDMSTLATGLAKLAEARKDLTELDIDLPDNKIVANALAASGLESKLGNEGVSKAAGDVFNQSLTLWRDAIMAGKAPRDDAGRNQLFFQIYVQGLRGIDATGAIAEGGDGTAKGAVPGSGNAKGPAAQYLQ